LRNRSAANLSGVDLETGRFLSVILD